MTRQATLGNYPLVIPQTEPHLSMVGAVGAASVSNNVWPTADMIYYYPFVLHAPYKVQAGFIFQNSAAASTVGRVGVYSLAGKKLDETNGTIDLTTAGTNVIRRTAFTSLITLQPWETYYVAVTVNNTGGWIGRATSFGNGGNVGSAGNIRGWRQEQGSGTLPATATFATYAPASERAWMAGLTNNTTVPL